MNIYTSEKEMLKAQYSDIVSDGGLDPRNRFDIPSTQEPVAWRNAAIRVGEDLCSVGPFGYYDMTAEQWLDWALSVVTVHASPPKRQPLRGEQIYELFVKTLPKLTLGMTYVPEWAIPIARAIEAAHGIGDKT